jgi:hypothetical protein
MCCSCLWPQSVDASQKAPDQRKTQAKGLRRRLWLLPQPERTKLQSDSSFADLLQGKKRPLFTALGFPLQVMRLTKAPGHMHLHMLRRGCGGRPLAIKHREQGPFLEAGGCKSMVPLPASVGVAFLLLLLLLAPPLPCRRCRFATNLRWVAGATRCIPACVSFGRRRAAWHHGD